jgi:transcription initiation factor IIF auxiliary subunit
MDINKIIINTHLEEEIKSKHTNAYKSRLHEVSIEREKFAKQKIHRGRIYVGNRHQLVPTRNDSENIHQWTLFIEPEGFENQIIEKVVVDLHPTFRPAQLTLTSAPFEVKRLGWGVFDIKIIIRFKQECNLGELEINHFLSFEGNGNFTEHEIDYKLKWCIYS